MRYYLSILLAFLYLSLHANNTIFTSSFEKEITEEWDATLSNGMPGFERIQTEKKSGEYGFYMQFNDATQKGNLITPKTIKWQAGQVYQISFWYKAVVPGNSSSTNIKFFGNDNAKIGQINLSDWNKPNWTQYTCEFIPSASDSKGGYVLFSFRPTNTGKGEYYFDDFLIEEVQKESGFWNDLKSVKMDSDSTIKWTPFGPGMSGNNKCAFWHPTDPNVLFRNG